ncbi:MAG: PIG-L deacetylase family protein [Candidatus Dormibacteria bacterium]
MTEDEPSIERVMVIAAHPDDAEFGAAGTIAKMTAQGIEATYVVVTAGNRGGEGERTEADLTRVREAEQRKAADILGVGEIINLGYDDGSLTPSLELRKDLVRVIRRYRPNIIFTQNPVRNFGPIGINHPDHLAVGEATFAAVYPTARNPMAFPELISDEGLNKWTVDWIYVFGAQGEDHYEDIAATIDRKVAALLAHESQLGPEVGDWMKLRAAELAKKARSRGMGEMEMAESFRRCYTGEIRRREDLLRWYKEEDAIQDLR